MLLNNDNGVFVFAQFTHHTYDTVLDVYFAEARFYDAKYRQWMTSDPMKDGLNWYQYVRSNPTTYQDPWGLEVGHVLINGKMITVDTEKKETVIEMLEVFDPSARSKSLFSGITKEIVVYTYATKNVTTIKYGKDQTISGIFSKVGFKNVNATQPENNGYFSLLTWKVTGEEYYYVQADDKFKHKLVIIPLLPRTHTARWLSGSYLGRYAPPAIKSL